MSHWVDCQIFWLLVNYLYVRCTLIRRLTCSPQRWRAFFRSFDYRRAFCRWESEWQKKKSADSICTKAFAHDFTSRIYRLRQEKASFDDYWIGFAKRNRWSRFCDGDHRGKQPIDGTNERQSINTLKIENRSSKSSFTYFPVKINSYSHDSVRSLFISIIFHIRYAFHVLLFILVCLHANHVYF